MIPRPMEYLTYVSWHCTLARTLRILLNALQDQPALAQGDGPIALVMAPTRELVQQIGKDVKRFGRVLGIVCVCVFGGSGIANQVRV